jgi:regulator of cell morphogenesis and NO signaling
LARVREKHGGKHHEIEDIEKLFGDVEREMIMHMEKEEQILFPYIDAESVRSTGKARWSPCSFKLYGIPFT